MSKRLTLVESQTAPSPLKTCLETVPVNLGLSTWQALTILRDQLFHLLEQQQKLHRRKTSWKGIEVVNAGALLILLLVNLFLIGRQEWLKKSEIVRRLQMIINQLNDLYMPSSTSWSLHWAYRDGQLVNIPVSLLVEGDVIALRPGQESFASLRGIKDDEHIVLEPGDLFPPFSPPPSPREYEKKGPQDPQQFRLFRVVRTPIIDNVKRCLDMALDRPVTALDNERFTVQSAMDKYACPVVLVAFLITNTVRFCFNAPGVAPWRFNFFQLQLAKFSEDTLSSYTEVVSSQEILCCIWRHFLNIMQGKSLTLCYTSSVLHSLGSVTVLCCVDKQGVLSWPNPSPETVLFFSGKVEPPHDSHEDLKDDVSMGSFCRMEGEEDREEAQEADALLCAPALDSVQMTNEKDPSEVSVDTPRSSDTQRPRKQKESRRAKHPSGSNICGDSEVLDYEAEDYVCDYHMEMLSLSQDQQNPVSIQFDSSSWQYHLTSLKPLGLNILLNLCNATVTEKLCSFSDHLSNIALQEAHGSVVPIHIPWWLCELARLIGAKELFKQEHHLAMYQLPSAEAAKEFGSKRLHQFTKRQPPLSHLISLLVRDSTTNNVQMLSHGTADLILEACTDFWDGSDIYPLSGSDRKKVLDFYQRACLSGYCSAFSYKPMQCTLSPEINGKCIELVQLPGQHAIFTPFELPGTTPIKYNSRRNSWSSDEGIYEVAEKEDCIQALSGQIFMGMVSSQYQARLDIVRLIDALVNACIRFVYFSMEDELRSKVFAEKMGLETGWNCHISLTPNGDGHGSEIPPSSPSHAGSLHEDIHQDSRDEGEGALLLDEERHSDLVSFQPTDSDVPSFLEDCNRAKLPRGIHQVRPHLKNIDNVPLLVPLFTDCTPETMCEMIKIMQENQEVTCCLGSSVNFRNNILFLQSDLSIALDPLYPSRCSWETFGYAASTNFSSDTEGLSPMQLSGLLNGLACSFSLQQEESVSIAKLIQQFVACLAQLPPPINITDILWLSCFCFPLLSNSEGAPNWFGELANGLLLIQKVMAAFLALHTADSSFLPNSLLGQVIQAIVDFKLWNNVHSTVVITMEDIPLWSWLLGSLSVFLVVVVNEVVKLHEIRLDCMKFQVETDLKNFGFSRVRVRYQKRQKLQFETKLGMNSPF
ncbi:TMM94 protein, partial [Polypterus senegalus]